MNCHPILALTPKEKEAIALLRHGFTNRKIAEIMCVSHRTVESHVSNVLRKLNAKNRTQAVMIVNGNVETDAELTPSIANTRLVLKAKVSKLKKLGCSNIEMARNLNTSKQRIGGILKQLGYPSPGRSRVSDGQKTEALEMRDQGYSVKAIAREIRLSLRTIYKILKEGRSSEEGGRRMTQASSFFPLPTSFVE
jgi:DNA-binding CsgD family transcriptional regulator